jgi:hypothetical protein
VGYFCDVANLRAQDPDSDTFLDRPPFVQALLRTVILMTDFGNSPGSGARYNDSEVWLCTENKGIAGAQVGTKVTSWFGPGSANI